MLEKEKTLDWERGPEGEYCWPDGTRAGSCALADEMMRYCDFRRMFIHEQPSYDGYDATDISFYERMLYENLQFQGIEIEGNRIVGDAGYDAECEAGCNAIKDWLAGARVYYRDCDFLRGYDSFIFEYHNTALYGAVRTFLHAFHGLDVAECGEKGNEIPTYMLPSGEYFDMSHLYHVYYLYPIKNPTQCSLLVTNSNRSLLLDRNGSALVSREGELFTATTDLNYFQGVCSFVRTKVTSTYNRLHYDDFIAVEYQNVTTTNELYIALYDDVRAVMNNYA